MKTQLALRIFGKSLLLMAFLSFTDSALAQQDGYYKKPSVLTDCKPESDKIDEKILYEYGAVYLSKDAKLPKKCRFENETDVDQFVKDEASIIAPANKFSFGKFYLQPQAKASLGRVFDELGGYKFVARKCNKSTTCTLGINDDWSLRTFSDTVFNWFGLRSMTLDQTKWKKIKEEISDFDKNGKQKEFNSRPRMLKVAIPGASQHHLGLAVDVNDKTSETGLVCGDACVDALEKNGWYRTVRFDRFHYTYLGYPKSELASRGLKKVQCSDTFTYWVPNVENYKGYKNWGCKKVEN
jgi:hypothetical protein